MAAILPGTLAVFVYDWKRGSFLTQVEKNRSSIDGLPALRWPETTESG
jgi:hypothetical protein